VPLAGPAVMTKRARVSTAAVTPPPANDDRKPAVVTTTSKCAQGRAWVDDGQGTRLSDRLWSKLRTEAEREP
jgi:hypothetical protein